MPAQPSDSTESYFNYFTEIEDCFHRCRGTPGLLSALDWALIESWKEAGIPLAAALTGIESTFRKFAKRPRRIQKINSLAYCSQSVLKAAEELKGHESGAVQKDIQPPFPEEDVRSYLSARAEACERSARLREDKGELGVAAELRAAAVELQRLIEAGGWKDARELEGKLTAMEEKLWASVIAAASIELLSSVQREVEHALIPYRARMTALETEPLGRQFLKRRLFEHYQVPRLSLFYL